MNEKQKAELREAAAPLFKWLKENLNAHQDILVSRQGVTVKEDVLFLIPNKE